MYYCNDVQSHSSSYLTFARSRDDWHSAGAEVMSALHLPGPDTRVIAAPIKHLDRIPLFPSPSRQSLPSAFSVTDQSKAFHLISIGTAVVVEERKSSSRNVPSKSPELTLLATSGTASRASRVHAIFPPGIEDGHFVSKGGECIVTASRSSARSQARPMRQPPHIAFTIKSPIA